ncbi:MAG: hypothetical protein IPJ65_15225 [Archangiaceae bacterium]|nr:hypothetical protein [Archangiaceae bacterium]
MPRAAILSFHSHVDRSFLDDRELAVLSGHLTQLGLENELFEVVVGGDLDATVRAAAAALAGHEVVIYERVWSPELIAALRLALPGSTFVFCDGEHTLPNPPAAWRVRGDPRQVLPGLLRFLRGEAAAPPAEALAFGAGGFASVSGAVPSVLEKSAFAPNLRPVRVGEQRPGGRTFSLKGNDGCPYQANARENPRYAGAKLPQGLGRGCAFCVTGNSYTSAPAPQTAASVLEQLRYLRRQAPQLQRLVLKDQNPFGYLTELIAHAEAEQLGPFTLLLETRADWMTKSQARFERALEHAVKAQVTLAPFLVGIENFSQAELDRFNKGTTGEANVQFLETLWRWRERFGSAFTLDEASFGFILFTPWTTLEDLKVNAAAIRRTRLEQLRGSLLLSRARLYPDTALYWLAERDGLIAASYQRPGDDSSLRYGYFPAAPWVFADARVAHFAAVAQAACEQNGSRDQGLMLERLVAAFEAAGEGYAEIGVQHALPPAAPRREPPPELKRRLEGLIAPLSLSAPFAGGWAFGDLSVSPGRLRIELLREREPKVVLELTPRGEGQSFAQSKHYDIHCAASTEGQRAAATAVASAIAANDR